MRLSVLTLLILLNSGLAFALNPQEQLQDPALESRARLISKQLRCLQCQNQTIDDSDAQIAIDLRKLVRKKILTGESDEAIINYVHEHYGDFVLMTPPIKPSTYGLWFLPFILLLAGSFVALVYLKRQSARYKESGTE